MRPSAPAKPPKSTMILTVTRACNLRCAYCPTAKDGWPSLTEADVRHAVRLFVERYGGGDIKMFGGEPLLVPEVVRAAMEAARDEPRIRRVYLSTNGLGLDTAWLDYLRAYPKGILTISMDGAPADHRRLRRAISEGIPDAYSHVVGLIPELQRTPRVVITQTIAPATAKRGLENFRHLVNLGFSRFNLLPGYFIPWRAEQLAHLATAFDGIADDFRAAWARGHNLYLRNLFVLAPTPFFNTGFVVASHRTIHPSNIGLSGTLGDTRVDTQVGTLDAPPTPRALAEKTAQIHPILRAALSEKVWDSTMAVDAELTRMCRGLYRDYLAHRDRKRAARAARDEARA